MNAPVSEGIRLAKRVAEMRQCSRSQAETLIEAGAVQVDGQVVQLPQFRVSGQTISIAADASDTEFRPVTLLLNKPADVDEGRSLLRESAHFSADPSHLRCIAPHFRHLTSPVPLEFAASGLIVFTQDGRISRKLLEDANFLEQEFTVTVEGEVGTATLSKLCQGQDTKVSISSQAPGTTGLRIAIKGNKPGQIAHACEKARLKILALRRLRIGRVSLAQLPVGQWRFLLDYERF